MEITTKLCDEEFARKAKAADFYHKAWDVFLKAGAGRGEDKLLDILLVFLVALIARNSDTLVELARQEITSGASDPENEVGSPDTLVSILFFILKNSADVDPLAMIPATDLEFKQIGLSKKDKVMVCLPTRHDCPPHSQGFSYLVYILRYPAALDYSPKTHQYADTFSSSGIQA